MPGMSVLAGLAALGPFFAVDAHPPGTAPAAAWRSGRDLVDSAGPLRGRMASVLAALAARGGLTADAIEPRVAASALHLGLAARLISPALGAAVLGIPLDLRLDGLWWQDELGRPLPLSVPAPGSGADIPVETATGTGTATDTDTETTAAGSVTGDWDRLLLDEVIAPVTAATARLTPVSGRVLWGNVASAVNAAAAQLARQRPDLADGAWRAAARLRASPRLGGERNPPGPAFRRSSCCLFYRLAPGRSPAPAAVCGDCVLAARSLVA